MSDPIVGVGAGILGAVVWRGNEKIGVMGSKPCEPGCQCGRHPQISAEDRFWSGIGMGSRAPHMDTPCWLWTRSTGKNGYPTFYVNGRTVYVHHFIYQLHYGPVPSGQERDHRCRVRRCVRPDHLRVGSRKQNGENLSLHSTNKSGIRGVYWNDRRQKWAGYVKHNGRGIHVGLFTFLGDAEAAVVTKRNELFTYNDTDRIEP